MVPHRPTGLVRHLEPWRFEQLIASLDASSPRGLRDRAIIWCIARLGLRAGEVAQLQLDDIDWRNAVVRVRARKTGHGALLPLPADVGAAVADYLQHARPNTATRQVFVLHRQRVGAPISSDIVGRAVDTALVRAGMDAPTRGANLLRHSLATDLLDRGAGLREIADLFGHARWPPPGSTPRSTSPRCARSRCPGRAGVVMNGGVGMSGSVSAWSTRLRRDAPRAGLPLGGSGARAAGLRPTPGPGRASGTDPAGGESGLGERRPPRPTRATRLAAWRMVRGFLRHLSAHRRRHRGARARAARPGRAPHAAARVFRREIAELLQPATGLAPAGGLRPHCYAVLFGLIACTGLRISEALALTCADVDLAEGVLTVRAGKRGRTRVVPLHPSALRAACAATPGTGRGASARRARMRRSSAPTAATGSATTPPTTPFGVLRRRLGWTAAGRTRAPRVHDLRHRMVVRRIQSWHAQGVDVDSKIPCWRPTSVTSRCASSTGTCPRCPS